MYEQRWFYTQQQAVAFAKIQRASRRYRQVLVKFVYGGLEVPNWCVTFW